LAAIIIISLVWVARDYPFIFDLRDIAIQTINAVLMVIVGLLMISNIKYYSFKQMDRKRVPFVVFYVFSVSLLLRANKVVTKPDRA
jgi:CDP-diacylglycerol--serine O-phosphatidyltransferase